MEFGLDSRENSQPVERSRSGAERDSRPRRATPQKYLEEATER